MIDLPCAVIRLLQCVQILHLEIDYHSLKKQSVRAEVADVAHMEEQLSNIASNMQVRNITKSELIDDGIRLNTAFRGRQPHGLP